MMKTIMVTIFALIVFCISVSAQNPSANLDQCANGGVGATPIACTGSAWQNGNVNMNQGHYLEGQFVPYRLKFSNLSTVAGNTHTVTIEWDTTQSGKHALDYLGTFSQTEGSANPCSGVSGCSLGSSTTFPIPLDVNVKAGFDGVTPSPDDITQTPGVLTLFGGTITGVSAYTLSGTYAGSSSTSITITFTANVANPVLAWSGHISSRTDWGSNNSAININGSPYHTRLVDLDGSGGNQDRALSADAVVFPATITIIKDAKPNSVVDFMFSATGLAPATFMLDDDAGVLGGDNILSNTQVFTGITDFGSANAKTVSEISIPSGWRISPESNCVETAGGGTSVANSTFSTGTATATIIAEEGEQITCTFVNAVVTAAPVSISGQVVTSSGVGLSRVALSLTDASTGVVRFSNTDSLGYFQFGSLEIGHFYVLTAKAKGYTFASTNLTPMDDVVGVTIAAN